MSAVKVELVYYLLLIMYVYMNRQQHTSNLQVSTDNRRRIMTFETL